jgi:hypothetical protein
MKATLKVITPKDAEKLLGRNTINRSVRSRRVDQYAKQIKDGQWRVTGEAIKVANDGTLLDGQHRLLAVIKAGIPAEFFVVDGLDPEVFKVLDSGLSRTNGDALGSLGFGDPKEVGAIAKLVIGVQAGINPNNTELMSLISRTDIINFCEAHRELITQALKDCRVVHRQLAGSFSAWGALYILCALTHKDGGSRIREFLNSVSEGANLNVGDPRLALRNWLVRHPRIDRGVGRAEHLGTYLSVYRNFAVGTPIQRLRTHDVNKGMPDIPHRW